MRFIGATLILEAGVQYLPIAFVILWWSRNINGILQRQRTYWIGYLESVDEIELQEHPQGHFARVVI